MGEYTVTYILRKLRWNLQKRSIENRVMHYCKIEFRPADIDAAFTDVMRKQEQMFMKGAK